MIIREGTPEEAGINPARVELIRERARTWSDEGGRTPSLVLAAAHRGVVFFHEAFGRQGPETDSPKLDKKALFPLASLTKPVTAAATMMLIEDGLLGLNRPVQEYIPEFKGEGKEGILVHNLLTHTSGLRNDEWMAQIDEGASPDEIPPPESTAHSGVHELLYYVYRSPLGYLTGSEMVYSDANYYLAGEIVRRVSGRSLAEFANDRIFSPLGMDDTYFIVPEEERDRAVRRTHDAPGVHMQEIEWMERPSPSAGLFSTALDMARFGQMFLNKRSYGDSNILSPASVEAMTRNQTPGLSANLVEFILPIASWGLGWSVEAPFKGNVYGEQLPGPRYFNHGGYGGVEMWVDPSSEIVGVYFSVVRENDSTDYSIHDADLFMNLVTAAVYEGKTKIAAGRSVQSWSGASAAQTSRKVNFRGDRVLRAGRPEDVGIDPDRVDNVVNCAKGWVDAGIHPSLNIAAARHGVMFLNETLGRFGPEDSGRPLTSDALFPLMSITKLITAAAVMILVDEGLVGLNRPVNEYIPEFMGEKQDKVLIRHLLTHTSGLRESDLIKLAREEGLLSDSDADDWAVLLGSYDDYLKVLKRMTPAIPAEQRMIYSQPNYDLLAEVVAQASGSTFSKFIHQRIFEPLGMRNSHVSLPEKLRNQLVSRPDSAPFSSLIDSIAGSNAAQCFGSAADITVFGQMFLNGGIYAGERILSQASVRAMTKDQIPGVAADYEGEEIGPAEWGLGWSIHIDGKSWGYDEPLLSQGSYCHGGSGGVFIWIDPVKDLVAVFFSTYLAISKYGHPAASTDLFINSLMASIADI